MFKNIISNELDYNTIYAKKVDLSLKDNKNSHSLKAILLDTINDAFDKLLDSLYEDDRMKIQTDIAVLKTLLSQEGLVDDGLHM